MTDEVLRGRLLTFHAEPQGPEDSDAYSYIEDGALLVAEGRIGAAGTYADIAAQSPGLPVTDHRPHLMMAGFIGTVGSRLLAPVMEASGLDLTVVPSWVILLAFVWGIPLTGQIGMNPILAVSLVAPVLPAPEALGLTAPELIVAITAGWAISGASSPYTATTLLIGAFGDVSPRHVGLVWNGLYIALAGVILSAWSLIFAALW